MSIEEACIILKLFNLWRRDDDGKFSQPNPKEVGESIDIAIDVLKQIIEEGEQVHYGH